MTVYTATRTYIRGSLLHLCYSQPFLSYVPPCAIADTCERCLHMTTATRQRPHGGRSIRVALFSINAWAHTQHAPTARPIKANYLKIVTIRPLYRDPMPFRMLSFVVLHCTTCSWCALLFYYKFNLAHHFQSFLEN